MAVGDQQVEGVGTEIHGRDSHTFRLSPLEERAGYRQAMSHDDLIAEARFRAMGTDVTVLALGAGSDALMAAADAIERLEAKWSRFRPTSELCRVNEAAGSPVVVSPETFALVQRAVDAWGFTDGHYDPTILPALLAAGYDRSFDELVPSESAPAGEPVPSPGCAGIVLDWVVGSVQLPRGVAIDLGGIGKGYAADLVARDLVEAGARGVLVNLGGDLRAIGDAPPSHGWVVEVDDPLGTRATGLLAIAAGAVATSTRLRRAWARAGRLMHHIVDPRSGRPAQAGLASVTVVAGEAWRAEVLAKAAFIAGPTAGARVITEAGATGLLVGDDGRVHELDGLAGFRA
jgi:thiamine biosynthesis lipoprotein